MHLDFIECSIKILRVYIYICLEYFIICINNCICCFFKNVVIHVTGILTNDFCIFDE